MVLFWQFRWTALTLSLSSFLPTLSSTLICSSVPPLTGRHSTSRSCGERMPRVQQALASFSLPPPSPVPIPILYPPCTCYLHHVFANGIEGWETRTLFYLLPGREWRSSRERQNPGDAVEIKPISDLPGSSLEAT
eukprot:1246256-Rhodomonas_salina.2